MTSSVGPQGINPPEIRGFKEFRSDIISGGSGFFEILEGLYLVGGTWLFLAHKLHQELTLAKKKNILSILPFTCLLRLGKKGISC